MTEPILFGCVQPGITYSDRRAAYAVVFDSEGRVAAVKSGQSFFLPGGGSEPHETPEDTVVREVREELGRGVRLVRRIAEAIQYFYARTDDRHYRMYAVFFAAEFPEEPVRPGEHELHWLPRAEADAAFFHRSHAWAAYQDE